MKEKDQDEIEFGDLTMPERKLLLSALEIDENKLVCAKCKKKTTVDKCSIMSPPTNKENKTMILCESILCMSRYLGDHDRMKMPVNVVLTETEWSDLFSVLYKYQRGFKITETEEAAVLNVSTKLHKFYDRTKDPGMENARERVRTREGDEK